MKIKLLILSIAVLCLSAAPARADMVLFDFHYGSLYSVYTFATKVFTASENALTIGSVTLMAPMSVAIFTPPWDGLDHFSLSMNISNIDNLLLTADAVGQFTLTDIDDDTITGNITGQWGRWPGANTFAGKLSNVQFTEIGGAADGSFDGNIGSVLMPFGSPWYGTLIELSSTGTWFGDGDDYTTNSGSVDASVVPVPGAVILGILGLGVVGWKLRRYA